jgi:hypothetical protein
MTAECEILVDHKKDVLTVPVAAVVEQQGAFYSWIKTAKGFEKRPLVLGATNDQFVEVQDGLLEGAAVVLNPRAVIPEARGVKEAVEDVDVAEKFGKERKIDPKTSKQAGKGAGAAAGVPNGPGAGGAESAPGGSGGPGGGERRIPGIADLDKDGDGKLSREEVRGPMQQFFDMTDGDSDGFIDAAEMAKARSMMRRGGGSGGPGGPPAEKPGGDRQP